MDIEHHQGDLTHARLTSHLNDIERITSYLSQTMSDFMNFFSKHKEITCFSMREILKDLTTIMGMSIERRIEVLFDLEEDIVVMGYRSELLQVLLIVVNNSIDACLLNEVRSPKIEIKVRSDKKQVTIQVDDNGGGIPSDIMDQVFDPYFTTKHQAKGTGLGLYILKVIVEKNMLGRVWIKNNQQGGVSFYIQISQLTFDNK